MICEFNEFISFLGCLYLITFSPFLLKFIFLYNRQQDNRAHFLINQVFCICISQIQVYI